MSVTKMGRCRESQGWLKLCYNHVHNLIHLQRRAGVLSERKIFFALNYAVNLRSDRPFWLRCLGQSGNDRLRHRCVRSSWGTTAVTRETVREPGDFTRRPAYLLRRPHPVLRWCPATVVTVTPYRDSVKARAWRRVAMTRWVTVIYNVRQRPRRLPDNCCPDSTSAVFSCRLLTTAAYNKFVLW